jgi:membrane protease YdiL (CAAX protease family)
MNTLDATTLRVAALGVLGFALFGAGCLANVLVLTRLATRPPGRRWALPALAARAWPLPDAVPFFALTALVNLAFFLTVRIQFGDDAALEPHTVSTLLIGQTLLFHGFIILLTAVCLRARRLAWRTAFGAPDRPAWHGAAWGGILYLAAIPYFVVAALLYRLVLQALHIEAAPQDVVTVFFRPDIPLGIRIYMVVVGIALAPLAEEILFRGVVFPLVLQRLRPAAAIAFSAALFAWMHLHVPALVPLFVIATAFALGYLYTGSLLTPIVMHALFNAVNLAALWLLRGIPGLEF